MTLASYAIAAIALIAAWHRYVRPVSRAAAVVVILLPTLFTGPALFTDRAYGPYDLLWMVKPFADYAADVGAKPPYNQMLSDLILQITPWQFQLRQSLAAGEWPLWNPTILAGQVLAANAQTAPYDPINLLALLLPPDLATTFSASMTLLLAALFAYGYARELDCSERASMIAAAGFMCSSAMAFWVGWPLGRSWAMLPLVLLSVRRLVRDADLRAAVLLTISLVLLIVCGHPETVLHVVAVGVVVGVFELIPRWRSAARPIAMAAACGVVALLLTAIYLLPFATAVPYSWQHAARAQSVTEWAASSEQLARAVRATFLPYSGGATWRNMTADWDSAPARIGSIILVLAIAAAIALWSRREVRLLVVLAVVTVLAGWRFAPVADALHALPLFDIAINDRLGAVAALCLPLLAAMAFDARERLWRPRTIALVVGAALAVATVAFWSPQLRAGVPVALLVAGAGAELAGIIAVVVALSLRSARAAFLLLLIVLAGHRVIEEGRIYPAVPRAMFFPAVPLIDAIPRDPRYRVIGYDNVLVPNIGTFYGLEDVRGYEAMTLESFADTWPLWAPDSVRPYREVKDLTRPFLSFLGVRWAVAPRSAEPPPGWRVAAEDRRTWLFENPRALPRVFVPRNIRYSNDHGATLREMSAAADFADVTWIYTKTLPAHTTPNGDAVVEMRRVGSRYEIDTHATSPTRIVITEAAWPGWRASIDGHRVSIQLANRSFLSVHVPAGSHRVRLEYLPRAFVQGRAITAGTLVVLISVAIWRRRKHVQNDQATRQVQGSA